MKSYTRYENLSTFYKLSDKYKELDNSAVVMDDTVVAGRVSMSMYKVYRGTYNCSKCKHPKLRGHVCPIATTAFNHNISIIPSGVNGVLSPSPTTVLLNALHGGQPRACTTSHTATYTLLPIINHRTSHVSSNHSVEVPHPSSIDHNGDIITDLCTSMIGLNLTNVSTTTSSYKILHRVPS